MQLLNVQEDGFLKPLSEVGDAFSPSNVIIAVHEESKRIFIWKGSNASVRKKFISARAAQKIRFENMAYSTFAIDSGEDVKLEQELMSLVKTNKITLPKPKIKPPKTTGLKGIAKAKRKAKKAATRITQEAVSSAPKAAVVPAEGLHPDNGDALVIDARPVLEPAEQVIPET
ncbi:MAG: hypothetical protein ACTSW4_04045, partial [Candidatus Ranarchaeia archaeon]